MAIIDMENTAVRDVLNDTFSPYRKKPQEHTQEKPKIDFKNTSLRKTVEQVISDFLKPFENESIKTSDMKIAQSINKNILFEIEAAVYEAVMHLCKGNQSMAAKVLGVSRGTLRTKLKLYYGTTHVGLI